MNNHIENLLAAYDDRIEIIPNLDDDYDTNGNKRNIKYWFDDNKIYTLELFEYDYQIENKKYEGGLFILPNGKVISTNTRKETSATLYKILSQTYNID